MKRIGAPLRHSCNLGPVATSGIGKLPRCKARKPEGSVTVLRGSWVVKSEVISRVAMVITHSRGLITPLITTHVAHEPFRGVFPVLRAPRPKA